jgi:A/G-specific adenine glycosylase
MTMRSSHNAKATPVNSEHRAYWIGKGNVALPADLRTLRSFFVRYARGHLRSFPWRLAGTEPFQLLVAELLLVQTKAEDVARVWPALVRRFPDPQSLSRARQSTLIRILRPLGLQRQRAHGLKAVSVALIESCNGEVPKTVEELLNLPHVGLYVATAIACFASGHRVPIVDGNVIRVFDRVTGVKGVRELRRRFDVWKLAWAALPRANVASHNYGLLDFAAQTCTSRAPDCAHCGLLSACSFGREEHPARPRYERE